MKKDKNLQELQIKLRELYINRYNALYFENNYVKGNQLERKFTKIEETLIVSDEGVSLLKELLDDDSEIVRYYSSSTLISLFPKKCKQILKEIEKNGQTHLSSDVKYVIQNYEQGNNYFQKFLKERESISSNFNINN